MWFSKVPGYIFDKQKTPYLTEAKELSLAQSQYELDCLWCFCWNYLWNYWISCNVINI